MCVHQIAINDVARCHSDPLAIFDHRFASRYALQRQLVTKRYALLDGYQPFVLAQKDNARFDFNSGCSNIVPGIGYYHFILQFFISLHLKIVLRLSQTGKRVCEMNFNIFQ